MFMCVPEHVEGQGQHGKSSSTAFSPYSQRQGLSVNLEADRASQLVLGILCHRLYGSTGRMICSPDNYGGSGDLSSDPHTCTVKALTAEPCLL